MDASDYSLEHAQSLVVEYARMRGRTCLEVTKAVLSTRTLQELGYAGDGHLTQRQCDAFVRILESWIRRAK